MSLKARTRSLGHLSLAKGDNYYAEVRDNSDCHSRVVVRSGNTPGCRVNILFAS
jgi:hypothetical protein